MRAARGAEAASSGRGEVSGGRLRRRLFYCDSLSLDQYRWSWSRAIKGVSYEDRPSGRWPVICCCWAFLVRTRDRIILGAAQCCTDRRRRGRRSFRYWPCLVRIAVAALRIRFSPLAASRRFPGKDAPAASLESARGIGLNKSPDALAINRNPL